jgi:hypothetical protein
MTFKVDPKYQPPQIEDPSRGDTTDQPASQPRESDGDWLKRARDAWYFSTSYVDSNYRKGWEDSIRAFNNQHASDSKYNSETFQKRSHVYRPKTRAVIRKNEAATAAAFFSNIDLIEIKPLNSAVKEQLASAETMQQLIQYRLTKSIPWFQVCMGGIQDAQVQGAVCAHVHWRFTSGRGKNGELVPLEDKPVVDLFPIENLRIDPSANWMDPVDTSPYLIHLIPMYVCDIKDRMEHPDPKGGTWKKLDDDALKRFIGSQNDTTRDARAGAAQDPASQRRTISDYDIIWVHRHIHRYQGVDWQFYTLESDEMLTDPELLENVVFHGKRPYVMGQAMLETHKAIPASLPTMTKDLASVSNDIINSRIDNVKLVLNKRWKVLRGKNVDMPSLVRNVPGGITQVDNMEDVEEINWPDVTSSAYAEQDRVNADFDELVGNFSASSIQTQRSPREPARAMAMLQAPSNLLTEYMLKTYAETFLQPVLRQLVMLEQHYETDQTIITLAGEKAQVFQRFGVSQVTDEMLDRELTLTVNVGMGATDPNTKLQKFLYGVETFAKISLRPPPGLELKEIWKEIAALTGYQDGSRFMTQDPDKIKAAQMNQQLMMMLKQMGMKLKDKSDSNVVKLQTTREKNAAALLGKSMDHKHSNVQLFAQHLMELEKQGMEQEAAIRQASNAGPG